MLFMHIYAFSNQKRSKTISVELKCSEWPRFEEFLDAFDDDIREVSSGSAHI